MPYRRGRARARPRPMCWALSAGLSADGPPGPSDGRPAAPSDPVQELPLNCEDGVLSTSDGTPLEKLQCLKYCGPVNKPDGASRSHKIDC